jgi:site-specific recombinase XerD
MRAPYIASKKVKTLAAGQKVKGIYFRNDRGVFYFARMQKGERVRVNLETSDYVEAVERAAAIQDAPELQPASGWQCLIDGYVKSRLSRNLWSKNSADSKRTILDVFARYFEGRKPSSITEADAQRYYHSRLQSVKPITANSDISTIGSFWSWLIDSRTARFNPWLSVKLEKVDTHARIEFVPYEKMQELIQNAPSDEMRFILYAGFHCGLRRDEIVNSQPKWFDLRAGVVRVMSTDEFRQKDRAAIRTIPLTPDFKAFLTKYPMKGKYMLRPDVGFGKWRYRWDFIRPYTNYMISQGMRWCTPHVMRHSFMSHLVANGESIFKVAQWMGDGVRVVEKHYAHLRMDDRSIDKSFPATPA